MATFYVSPMFFGFAPQPVPEQEEKICPVCKTSLAEIAKTSVVGCPHCYETFEEELLPWIQKVQGTLQHVGKVGEAVPAEVRQEYKKEVLKSDLQKAIAEERYEDAAVLRDKISAFESQNGGQ